MTTDTRNHDGLGKQSPLLRGMPVFPLSMPIREVIATAQPMRACVWYDAGEAGWREGEYVVSQQLQVAIYVASN